jgi:phosphoglycerate dehydrogenase-like enzyme
MIVLTTFNIDEAYWDDNETKQIVYVDEGRLVQDKQLLEEAEVIFCNQRFFSREFLDNCKNLKWIQLPSSGFEKVDLEIIRERGIILTNARGVYSIPMAEDAFCKILMLARNSMGYLSNQDAKNWNAISGTVELNGKNIGILGVGSVAREVAIRAKAFNMRVLGYGRQDSEDKSFDKIFTGAEGLRGLCLESDFIVSAIPLSNETRNMIDEELISIMKKNVVLVNISRGGVINEEALIKALQQGKIAGAALDVFANEPLSKDSELWKLPNVIITPHQAGAGDRSSERMKKIFLENLRAYPRRNHMTNIIR